MLMMTEVVDLSTLFQMLSDPTRRRMVELLSAGALRAGELAAAAGVSAPVASKHLRALLANGIVDDERSVTDARVRLFFLRRERLAAAGEWLAEVASQPR